MANVLDLRKKEGAGDTFVVADEPDPDAEPAIEPKTPPLTEYTVHGLQWQALEYEMYYKPSDWYWALGILTLGLVVVAAIMQNVLFGVFALLAGFTLAMFGAKPPRVRTFSINHEGVRIDAQLHPFDSLKSFWIFYTPPIHQELRLETKRSLQPHLTIPLGDTNPLEVRVALIPYMPEKPQEESLIEIMSQYLRF